MLPPASSEEPLLLAEVPSTNDWLRQHAGALPNGQWVRAERQIAGRGRRGHVWEMLPGNLAASCLLQRAGLTQPPAELGFVVALALYEVCADLVARERLLLKWPNDVLLDGAKLSGILLELEPDFLILGVGVNIVAAPALPGRRTISLMEAGVQTTATDFCHRLMLQFAHWCEKWRGEGFPVIRDAWLARAHPLGTPLVVQQNGLSQEGVFAGLGGDGSLLFDGPGRRQTIHAGDVWIGSKGDAARC